jgi:O-antigen/teichoic acid export membrane protein
MSEGLEQSQPSRVPLPEGTVPVAIGLFLAGFTAYAFFKVGQVALGKEHFKPIVALWFTTFALVPGFYMPIEQELGRAIAHRKALGQGSLPVVRKMIALSLALSSILVVVILACSPWLTEHMFEGYWAVTIALVVAFIAYAPMHMARGIVSGSARFQAYGIIMGVDGLSRIGACTLLWILGVENVGAYAIAVVAAPLVAVSVVALRKDLNTQDGPPATFAEITPNLGWLLLGSVMGAALVNAGPLGVNILANSGEAAKVTAFGNGVLLSRVPLFLFQAVQAALLPRLARLAAQGAFAEFRHGLSTLVKIVIGVAVLGTVGSFVLGPWALQLVYGDGLDRRTLTLLALARGLYMLALTIAQAVIALHGHRFVAYGWLAAMASFVSVTAFASDDLYLRVELGLVAGSTAALVIFAFALRTQLANGETPDAALVAEGILDSPFGD